MNVLQNIIIQGIDKRRMFCCIVDKSLSIIEDTQMSLSNLNTQCKNHVKSYNVYVMTMIHDISNAFSFVFHDFICPSFSDTKLCTTYSKIGMPKQMNECIEKLLRKCIDFVSITGNKNVLSIISSGRLWQQNFQDSIKIC